MQFDAREQVTNYHRGLNMTRRHNVKSSPLKSRVLIHLQSSLAITLSPGGIFWDRGISEARYRFCRQFFFFNLE